MTRDSLRHHRAHQTKNVMGDSFMERVSERVASGMGTVQFIVASTVIIAVWVLVNHAVGFLEASYHGLLTGKGFDPAPFILLNLVFSAVAFFTGALVIIAQKAAAKKDAAREAADAEHREELAVEQTKLLAANTNLTQQVHDLSVEMHAILAKPRPVRRRPAKQPKER